MSGPNSSVAAVSATTSAAVVTILTGMFWRAGAVSGWSARAAEGGISR
jgi:hypothetical protein